jgi:large subunit ribosomal protein L25
MENTQPLKATIRENLGKGPARRLRVAGKLPGVVYGKDFASTNVAVEPKALLTLLRGEFGLNSIFKLEIEGVESAPVVRVIKYQRDPIKRNIKHVDFEVLHEEKVLMAKVPLRLEGLAKGIAAGGTLRQIRHTITIKATPGSIPRELVGRIDDLAIGDMLRISDISVPEGVEIYFQDNFSVATVFVPRGIEAEASEEGEEGEEGEEEGE